MVKVTICIGSSCHLKGSRQVVEGLQELIKANNLQDGVELSGSFCMGKCSGNGVSVTVDDEYCEVKPENLNEFFTDKIVAKLQ